MFSERAELSAVMVMPVYSGVGVGNRDLFLDYRNSVLFYFEDEGAEEFYVRLLRRVGLGAGVEDVFCLGGKAEMAKRYREPPIDGKRRLFVFDKDFDDLIGEVFAGEGVVYLGRYSIENYFLHESLLVDFAVSRKKGLQANGVRSELKFDEFLATVVSWYDEMCRKFVVARRFRLKGVKSTKVPGPELCDPLSGEVNTGWRDGFLRAFEERLHFDQSWVLDGDRLPDLLESAFRPGVGLEGIADDHPMAHYAGKQLLRILVARLCRLFGLGDEDECCYQFMMTSVLFLPEADALALKRRFESALN